MASVDDEVLALTDEVLRAFGDPFSRARPVDTVVNGRTVSDFTQDVVTSISGRLYAQRGALRELGWGVTPTGQFTWLHDSAYLIAAGDQVEAEAGRWLGRTFRVVEVDPATSRATLELVNAANT